MIKNLHFLMFPLLLLSCNELNTNTIQKYFKNEEEEPKPDFQKLKNKAHEAYHFNELKNLNKKYCFLIDLSMHSGSNRFFIWNFSKDTVVDAFPVTHGCCNGAWGRDNGEAVTFSNVPDSHCSSEGKYRIGERGYSSWGINIKYLLLGLDSTNNKALQRTIVLHGWNAVSDSSIFPERSPRSWGCPAVGNLNMTKLDRMLNRNQEDVLLWIF